MKCSHKEKTKGKTLLLQLSANICEPHRQNEWLWAYMQFAFRRRERQASKRILLVLCKIDMEELKIIGWCHYPYICVQIYIGTVFLNIPPKFFIVLYEVFIHIHRGWCEGWLWGEVCFLYHFWKPCILNYTADFLDKWKNIPPSPKQLKMSPDCRSYLGISQHLMISLCKSNLFSRSGLFIIWWQLQGMRKKWHTLSERDLFWEVREGEGFWAMNNGIPILYWTFIDLLG